MHVLFISFCSNQRITQNSIIFHPREFSYAFNVISTNIPFIRAFLIKKSIICLFFSKLDLSAYLYYYMLSLAFYFKNYCIFFNYSLSESSLSPAATRGESPIITYIHDILTTQRFRTFMNTWNFPRRAN